MASINQVIVEAVCRCWSAHAYMYQSLSRTSGGIPDAGATTSSAGKDGGVESRHSGLPGGADGGR